MPYCDGVTVPIVVALEQQQARVAPGDICLAIDVLRATTTLSILFARGSAAVWLASDTDAALAYARQTGRLVCGERGGLPPPGFDFGNSPLEMSRADGLQGRELVMATTNGTNALRIAAAGSHVFAASYANGGAVVRAVRQVLQAEIEDPERRIHVICAGTEGRVGLDDVACAGSLVAQLLVDLACTLDDGAEIALRVHRSFDGALDALRTSGHARTLLERGLGEDIHFSSQRDITGVVPALDRGPWPIYLIDADETA